MATTPFENLPGTWDVSNRYTAVADTDIKFSNIGYDMLRWSITTSDTAPVITVSQSHKLRPLRSEAFTLKTGERLWLAGPDTSAALEV